MLNAWMAEWGRHAKHLILDGMLPKTVRILGLYWPFWRRNERYRQQLMARAKRHYIPGQIWHIPVKYACPVQPSTRGPQSGIPQGKHLTGVGSKRFVEHVKSVLGALAKGRKPRERGKGYKFRKPSASYGEHFGAKNEDIGPQNTYFWNINP